MPFELMIDGKVYRTDDLTLAEAEIIERECGKTWLELNPMRSAREYRATATVFLRRFYPDDEAAKRAGAISIRDAQDAMKWTAEDLPDVFENGIPKAGDGVETTGSSSSPEPPGTGPLP